MTPTLAFDLDGTLIDARARQVGVAAQALAEVGGERLNEGQFWRAKRNGATTQSALVTIGVATPLAAEAARRWAELIESDLWVARDRPLPGAGRVLRSLRRERVRIAVLTARRRPEGAARSVEAAGLAALVDELEVVDPADARDAKAGVLTQLGAAAFVGDSATDGEAAVRAGIPFVGVSTGQRTEGYLSARGFVVARSLSGAVAALRPLPSALLAPEPSVEPGPSRRT